LSSLISRLCRVVIGALALLLCGQTAWASPVVDSVNGDGTPPFLAFTPNNIGWVYVPSLSYTLDGVFSNFRNVGSPTQAGPVLPRTVTLSIYDTNASGALLARTTFGADGSGGQLGGRFTPVLLLAGHKYFVAYDNVYNLGLNLTNWIPNQAPGTVNLEGWYTGQNFGTYYPKLIDGVLQVFSAPILNFEGTRVTTLAAADCLFNWAERFYPSLFAPAGRVSAAYQAYYYRYYAGTNAYVGVSALDNHVYYIGPSGALLDVGPLPGWLTTAGCS